MYLLEKTASYRSLYGHNVNVDISFWEAWELKTRRGIFYNFLLVVLMSCWYMLHVNVTFWYMLMMLMWFSRWYLKHVWFSSALGLFIHFEENLHPGRLTRNLTHLEGKMIFPTSMTMFHVNLPGCFWNGWLVNQQQPFCKFDRWEIRWRHQWSGLVQYTTQDRAVLNFSQCWGSRLDGWNNDKTAGLFCPVFWEDSEKKRSGEVWSHLSVFRSFWKVGYFFKNKSSSRGAPLSNIIPYRNPRNPNSPGQQKTFSWSRHLGHFGTSTQAVLEDEGSGKSELNSSAVCTTYHE